VWGLGLGASPPPPNPQSPIPNPQSPYINIYYIIILKIKTIEKKFKIKNNVKY